LLSERLNIETGETVSLQVVFIPMYENKLKIFQTILERRWNIGHNE